MLKLKIGDKVRVLSGKDKGREGQIEKILLKAGKAVVPGVNVYKRHIKGSKGQKSGVYDIPRPMTIGRLMLICSKCKKAVRVGIRVVDGKKIRICKKCDQEI